MMEKSKEPGIRTETNLPYVPDGEGNLAWRAAKLLMDEVGLSEGVDIKIRKVFPWPRYGGREHRRGGSPGGHEPAVRRALEKKS